MKKIKVLSKLLAAVLAMATIFCCTSCKDTSYALTSGKETVPAGVYLGFMVDAYYTAANSVPNPEEDLFKQKIDKVDVADYIKTATMDSCKRYLTVNRLFDEYKLSFTDEETKVFEATVDNYWSSASPIYEENGCGKESFKKMLLMDEKYDKIFHHYYGEGGKEPVSEKDRKEFFSKNYAKIKYIDVRFSNHFDGLETSANATDKQKNELKDICEKYVDRLKKGESIDKLIEEEAKLTEKEEEEHDHEHDEEESDYTFLLKDTDDEPDAFNKAVFKAKYNTPSIQENSVYGYYVYVRYETDASSKDYTERAEGVLTNMKQDDFTKVIEKQIKKLKYTENKAAIKRFKPQNITIAM